MKKNRRLIESFKMSVLTIAAVSGAIAIGFYCVNSDQQNKRKLRESTAMVFILSAGVLLLAKTMGIGGGDELSSSSASIKRGGGGGIGGGSGASAGPALSYMLGGEPPF